MTDAEQEAAAVELRALQKRITLGIHELINIMAILKGEVDLAADRARTAIAEFYLRYPEFKDGP